MLLLKATCRFMQSSRRQTNTDLETKLIVFKDSCIHGRGGFAKTVIPLGTPLLEYVGEKIDKQESARRCEQNNVFIFSLNDQLDLDGNVPWNPARYVNHSCSPTSEAQLVDDRIWLVALRDLARGDEITFNYGFDLVNYRDYPCQCGSPNCVGFIVAEEFFDHIRKQNALRQQNLR